ncbi:9390_t:CDS:2 [Scutellospora calospora]|uniref:9390_t:CDS:1 n=1 Tax=Scutellospora calospora TaxID=85575 RepID=A0ACA9L8P5_9GLOM|nr:9390_t:CDS:2 [Scutellospora calospora]
MQIDKPLTTNNIIVDSLSFSISSHSQATDDNSSSRTHHLRKFHGADTILRRIKKKAPNKHLTAKAKRRQTKGLRRALMNIEKEEVKIAKISDKITLKKKIKNIWG